MSFDGLLYLIIVSKDCRAPKLIFLFFFQWPDIKVKEQTVENLMKGRPIFEPPRYMTVNQAAQQLMEVSDATVHPC